MWIWVDMHECKGAEEEIHYDFTVYTFQWIVQQKSLLLKIIGLMIAVSI